MLFRSGICVLCFELRYTDHIREKLENGCPVCQGPILYKKWWDKNVLLDYVSLGKETTLEGIKKLSKISVHGIVQDPDNNTAVLKFCHNKGMKEDEKLLALKILISYPAFSNLNICNLYGHTPLSICCENKETSIIIFLLENGARPDFDDLKKKSIFGCCRPMSIAAIQDNLNLVSILLYGGGTCLPEDLEMAAMFGSTKVIDFFINIIEMNVNLRGIRDKTPLMWAAENNYMEAVDLLCKNGAQVKLADIDGNTAEVLTTSSDIKLYLANKN